VTDGDLGVRVPPPWTPPPLADADLVPEPGHPGSGAGSGTGPEPVLELAAESAPPAPQAAGVRLMTADERMRILLGHWLRNFRASALRPGALLHAVRHAAPRTMAGHLRHVRSGEWVPEELRSPASDRAQRGSRDPAAWILVAGWLHYATIGTLLKVAAKGADALGRSLHGLADHAWLFWALVILGFFAWLFS
jgi:hypothetical protein